MLITRHRTVSALTAAITLAACSGGSLPAPNGSQLAGTAAYTLPKLSLSPNHAKPYVIMTGHGVSFAKGCGFPGGCVTLYLNVPWQQQFCFSQSPSGCTPFNFPIQWTAIEFNKKGKILYYPKDPFHGGFNPQWPYLDDPTTLTLTGTKTGSYSVIVYAGTSQYGSVPFPQFGVTVKPTPTPAP